MTKQLIYDSRMNLEQALMGQQVPDEIRRTLVLVEIQYLSFDRYLHQGQLVVHRDVEREVKSIFDELSKMYFPIGRAIPVVAFDCSDEKSMAANNTSAFNFRPVFGTTRLSRHALGLAIDVNPALNPYLRNDGLILPPGATYDESKPGTITRDVASIFCSRGWNWGGDWPLQDWQHFQKD